MAAMEKETKQPNLAAMENNGGLLGGFICVLGYLDEGRW